MMAAENMNLQEHLRNVTQRTTETHRQRTEMEKLMVTKLEEISAGKADASSLDDLVLKYRELYADYGRT
jgi:hypothetical protein